MVRTLAWPASPKSRIMLDVRVKAVSASEWTTDIYVTGAYDGPNDIAANKAAQAERHELQLGWRRDACRRGEAEQARRVRHVPRQHLLRKPRCARPKQ